MRQGGKKAPGPENLSHISYNEKPWRNYTLPKEDPKNIWITWHNLWVLLTSVFFRRKEANFAISGNKPFDTYRLFHTFWYIISIYFNFSWVFKDCYNKHGQSFDDVCKNVAFFEGWSWFKFNSLVIGTNLKICTSVANGLKLKVRKFLGLTPTFVEIAGEKLVARAFLSAPHPG